MKILHLTTTKKGGAGIFALDFARYLEDLGHDNIILGFRDFLNKRFLKVSLSVLIYLFKSFLILKFKKKNNKKIISPIFSLWSSSKIENLVSSYDLVIIQRFSNFLSFQEIVQIINASKKVIILGIDEGLFNAFHNYRFDSEKDLIINEKIALKLKVNLSNGDRFSNEELKSINPKQKASTDVKIENILNLADFSNTEIIVANDYEKFKLQNSFWRRIKIKISTKIFPYLPIHSEDYLNSLFLEKIKFFDEKLIITISALSPTKRKGFDIILKFLENLNSLYSEKNRKIIEINIITGDNSTDFEKFSNINLKIKYHNILEKEAFEIILAKSHLFLSFSRADSGPFTLNMCYYLKTMIFSFRVGVATEIEKKTKSVRIIDNFSAKNMAKQTLKLANVSSQNIKNLLTYNIENKWI